MESFVAIVNGEKPFIIIVKLSIEDLFDCTTVKPIYSPLLVF